MSRVWTAGCDCGWTGGPYRSRGYADYGLSRHSCDKFQREQATHARGAARRASVERTPKPCPHPQRHDHGTHAAYVMDCCRCRPCSGANAAYERTRTRQGAYGRWQPFVPADTARSHVKRLMAAGVGLKRVSQQSGAAASTLHKLVYGVDGKPAALRVRSGTEARLLAVSSSDHAAGARVPVTSTARRLQALACAGWSVDLLATHAGVDRQPLDRAIRGGDVLKRTVDTVARLYADLRDQPPPEGDRGSRASVTRSRRRARAAGWVPADAWDDIDDVLEDPRQYLEESRSGIDPVARSLAQLEDLEDLAGAGETLAAACVRVQMSSDYARKLMRRYDRADLADRFARNDPLWRDPRRTITASDADKVKRHLVAGELPLSVQPRLGASRQTRRTA